jgi:hypothetical protein
MAEMLSWNPNWAHCEIGKQLVFTKYLLFLTTQPIKVSNF